MPRLIKGTLAHGGEIVDDAWRFVSAESEIADLHQGDALALPLAMIGEWAKRVLAQGAKLGVVLQTSDDATAIAPWLGRLDLITIHFASFNDGRGYSIARLLRERHGYIGELRAQGDVLRDQVFYLLRCGFDSLEPRADQDVHKMLRAFSDFSNSYQSAVDHKRPLFARDATAHGEQTT